MNLSKKLGMTALAFLFFGAAHAQTWYTAPFSGVEVKAASKIYVNYNFDAHKQTLVCSEETTSSAITSAEWFYKDASRKIGLPITLKDDASFEGYWADTHGLLVITNEFGSSMGGQPEGSIFVSCQYRDM